MGEYLEGVGWEERFTRQQTHVVKRTVMYSSRDITDQGEIASMHYNWCRSDECNGYWMNFRSYLYDNIGDPVHGRVIGYDEFWMFSDSASAIAFKLRFV